MLALLLCHRGAMVAHLFCTQAVEGSNPFDGLCPITVKADKLSGKYALTVWQKKDGFPWMTPQIKTVEERNYMEFLKEILGEALYNQFVEKVNAHNGSEDNKDKQIKLENVNSGKYVSKLKYEDIVAQLSGRQTELETANNLIAELKKGNKSNDDLQGKVTQYEQTIANLQAQFHEEKVKSAIKVNLLSEKAVDVDYLTFKLNEKLKEKGETLELDENDNIKGWDDKLSSLKIQFPTMFESSQRKIIEENRLPEGDKRNDTITKEAFAKMGYKSRVELKESNPELYSKLTN